MASGNLEALVRRFCEWRGSGDVGAVLAGASLLPGEIAITLQTDKSNDIWIVADLGLPPAGCELKAYRAMLERNIARRAAHEPLFALRGDSTHMVTVQPLPPELHRSAVLASHAAMLAMRCRQWRRSILAAAAVNAKPRLLPTARSLQSRAGRSPASS